MDLERWEPGGEAAREAKRIWSEFLPRNPALFGQRVDLATRLIDELGKVAEETEPTAGPR